MQVQRRTQTLWIAVRVQKTEDRERGCHRPVPLAKKKHKAGQVEKAMPRDMIKAKERAGTH